MYSITSIEQISYFHQVSQFRPTVISVFLGTTFEQTAVDWIFRNWRELHAETGMTWHLLVPTFDPIDDDLSKAKSENINSRLVREIASMYNINERELPCIVFDDFNEEHNQCYVKIEDWSGNGARDFLYNSRDIIANHVETKKSENIDRWRQDVIASIFNAQQARSLGESIMKKMPTAVSIARLASNIG